MARRSQAGTGVGGEAQPRDAVALEARAINKSFGHVAALQDVDMELHYGMIRGLLGDNGAGKSTLVKVISGLLQADSGTVRVNGETVTFGSAEDARKAGVETVHQTLALVPSLDVASNLFLNRERVRGKGPLRRLGWLNRRAMICEAQVILDGLGVRLGSMTKEVQSLSGGQRQGVAIGRAASWGRNIVLLDEPTAALGVQQSATVLNLMRRLRDRGVAVLLISHNMQDVVSVCDSVTVLRQGRVVADMELDGTTTPTDLVGLITGARR